MALSELLHAWELLKKGAWGGIIVGLAFGLYMQDFPLMSVLYSLSHHEGSVQIQSARIIYWVTDLSQPPFELRRHELNLVTLILWAVLGCSIALLAFGKLGHQDKAGVASTNKAHSGTEAEQKRSQSDEGKDKERDSSSDGRA